MTVEVVGDAKAWSEEEIRELAVDGFDGVLVPGIVRRQEQGAEGLCVGFSSPFRKDGMRLRLSSCVPRSAVTLVRDPYQVAGLARTAMLRPLPVFDALSRALRFARGQGLACGVFGSAALELATGLPYCDGTSDLDLLVRCEGSDEAQRLHEGLLDVEGQTGVRIDAEIELEGGWAAKLGEFCSDSGSVLVKGFNDVRLLPREEAVVMNHR